MNSLVNICNLILNNDCLNDKFNNRKVYHLNKDCKLSVEVNNQKQDVKLEDKEYKDLIKRLINNLNNKSILYQTNNNQSDNELLFFKTFNDYFLIKEEYNNNSRILYVPVCLLNNGEVTYEGYLKIIEDDNKDFILKDNVDLNTIKAVKVSKLASLLNLNFKEKMILDSKLFSLKYDKDILIIDNNLSCSQILRKIDKGTLCLTKIFIAAVIVVLLVVSVLMGKKINNENEIVNDVSYEDFLDEKKYNFFNENNIFNEIVLNEEVIKNEETEIINFIDNQLEVLDSLCNETEEKMYEEVFSVSNPEKLSDEAIFYRNEGFKSLRKKDD
ncbi:hypothetical protein HERIO_2097 [Hepatospora eriocheir]|uniref:Uncharacterized protein n=1 Tax=Hepatospora eriocheir TaxID=1081669 RepID=A0A1X0Q861_9MICR|nr:hypothetical protein HERIO_2097 [Hepatospora eriocheir]